MGRTQSFDTADVVRSARTVFWQHGYEGAALPDLERATGLNRSSLYHAFGSKHGLFDAAVQSYLDEIVRPRLAPLRAEDVAPDAVITYFTGLRAVLADPDTLPGHHGCLLLNAAGSPAALEEPVQQVIAEYRAELYSAMQAGIEARRPSAKPVEVARMATMATSLIVSALMLSRVDNAASLASVDAALDLLA